MVYFQPVVRLRFVIDIDECKAGASDCDMNADCTNTEGSYNCTCQPGYTGNGTTCTGWQIMNITTGGEPKFYQLNSFMHGFVCLRERLPLAWDFNF